ncbi:MAG: hypothetical protein V1865_01120 [bacterium]
MMYTTNRKVGFLIIFLGVVILVAVVYFIFFYNFGEDTEIITEPEETVQQITPVIPEEDLEPVSFLREDLVQTPVQLAVSFIERFGTYSNQAPSNLNDLNLFMTTAMADWARKNLKFGEDYENYYGITTIAVSSEVQEETNDYAKILIHTSRKETKLDQDRIFSQDAVIEVVLEGKRWKVDAVYWK